MTLIERLRKHPGTARKFITALIGACAVAISVGLLPAMAGDYLAVVVAFATAFGVYVLPNTPEQKKRPVERL